MFLSLVGVAAAAHYEGTTGNDSFTVPRGGSSADLRAGNDTFVGAPGKRGGGDHVDAGSDDDDVKGRTFADVLRGKRGSDTLNGGAGRDGVYGGEGNDTLIGGGKT